MASHPNSLANLQAPFAKGHDPRRSNTRSLGASLIEWMNRLDVATTEELERIAKAPNGPDNPHSKAAAAPSIIRGRTQGFAKNGAPLAANDVDRILDRTHGKATQRVEVTREEVRDPMALRVELVRLLAEHPELRSLLVGEVVEALPASVPGDPPGAPNKDAGEV